VFAVRGRKIFSALRAIAVKASKPVREHDHVSFYVPGPWFGCRFFGDFLNRGGTQIDKAITGLSL